jgi:hypothetical protein
MKKRNEDDSNNQEKHSEELSAEDLKELNRLLERLHQADCKLLGSIEINIYKPGSQHVDHVENQNFYGYSCPKPKKTSKGEDASTTERFGKDTPLSALFRENHHEELKTIIESWRPYLIGDDTTVDALAMTHFEFDRNRIYSNKVYRDLCELDAIGALHVPLSQLAYYLADHSNLSRSYATLYQQLKNYRSEYVAYSP